MKVYTLGSGWYDSNHNRSIFAITGFDNVEIRDLNIEVRPHPDLNLLLDGDLCRSQNMQRERKDKCEELYQNLFTKYLFPDNYREVFFHTLRSTKHWNLSSVKMQQITILRFPMTQIFLTGGINFHLNVQHHIQQSIKSALQDFDLYKYLRMTGNIFFIVDNKNVSIANVNTKGFTAESHFSLQSNDFVEIDGISSQGISAQELIDQGVPHFGFTKRFCSCKSKNFQSTDHLLYGKWYRYFQWSKSQKYHHGLWG